MIHLLFRLRHASQGLSFLLLVFNESTEGALLILPEETPSSESLTPSLGLVRQLLEAIGIGILRATDVDVFMAY